MRRTTLASEARVPWRWTLAGHVAGRVPDWRGRQRLRNWLSGPRQADGIVEVDFGPGLVFLADLSASSHLYFFRFLPPALARVFDAVVEPGDHVVDVGANEGIYACWAARRTGPSGNVTAFEPVPETFHRLQANIERNNLSDVIQVVTKAAGDIEGQTTVWLPDAGHGLASVAQTDHSAPIPTEMTTLDAHLGGARARLIKIDVEGFEPAVLRGAHNMLNSAHPPIVLFEVVQSHLQRLGYSVEDAITPLTDAGYEIFNLSRRGLTAFSVTRPGSPNLLALHPAAHSHAYAALGHVRFPRDQTY